MKNKKIKQLTDQELLEQIYIAEDLKEGNANPEIEKVWNKLLKHERKVLTPKVTFRRFKIKRSFFQLPKIAFVTACITGAIAITLILSQDKIPQKLSDIKKYKHVGSLTLKDNNYTIKIKEGDYTIKRSAKDWIFKTNRFKGHFNIIRDLKIKIDHPFVVIENYGTQFTLDIDELSGKIFLQSGKLKVFHKKTKKLYILDKIKEYSFNENRLDQKENNKSNKRVTQGRVRKFILFNGRVYKGHILKRGEKELIIQTTNGNRVKLSRDDISQMEYHQ